MDKYELLLVGGSVRDKLLNRSSKDLDYVVLTDLSFSQLQEELIKDGHTIFLAKEEFLTIRAKDKEGKAFDIAFPRTDGIYLDGRRPESISLTSSLLEDSNRRDFTINAMYEKSNGEIIDFHNGINDLRFKEIKCVGNPDERFSEDYLRILRAVRFACTLNFIIVEDTYEAMRNNSHNLRRICPERIREELNKALIYNPYRTFDFLSYLLLFPILAEKGITFETTLKQRRTICKYQ